MQCASGMSVSKNRDLKYHFSYSNLRENYVNSIFKRLEWPEDYVSLGMPSPF